MYQSAAFAYFVSLVVDIAKGRLDRKDLNLHLGPLCHKFAAVPSKLWVV